MNQQQSQKFNRIFESYTNLRSNKGVSKNSSLPPEDSDVLGGLSLRLLDHVQEITDSKLGQNKQYFIGDEESFYPLIKQKAEKKALDDILSQKSHALQQAGFVSPDQNLQNIQNQKRLSTYRTVHSSNGNQFHIHKRLKRLLACLAETHFRETWKPKLLPQIIQFNDEDESQAQSFQAVISDLNIILSTHSQQSNTEHNDSTQQQLKIDRLLEIYLQNNNNATKLLNQNKISITKSHFILDKICQQIAPNTKSVSLLIRFACLTGNVCYLLQAINALIQYPELVKSIRGDELLCKSAHCDVQQNNEQPIIVKKLVNSKYLLCANACLFIEALELSYVYDREKNMLQRFNFNQQEQGWQLQDQQELKINAPFCMTYFFDDQSRNYELFIVDSNCEVFALGVDGKQKSSQKLDFIRKTIKQLPVAFRVWQKGEDIFVTTVLKNNNQFQIVTTQKDKEKWFEVNYQKSIADVQIYSAKGLIGIHFRENDGSEGFEFKHILAGQTYNSPKIESISIPRTKQTQEIYQFTKPECPQIKTQTFDKNKTYQWNLNGKEEVLKLVGTKATQGQAVWSETDSGHWKYSEQKLFIQRGINVYQFCFSEDGLDLLLLPEKLQKVHLILPDQDAEHVKMIAYNLSSNNFNPTVESEYGKNNGRECPKNLVQSGTDYWNKWCAVDTIDGKSWIKITFQKQAQFCGVGLKTANDCAYRDPKSIQVYIATPKGEWKFIKSEELPKTKNYQRHEIIPIHTGHFRTHSLLIHLQNAEGKELQLNEILLYSEFQPTKSEFIDLNKAPILTYIQSVKSCRLNQLKYSQVTSTYEFKFAFEKIEFPLKKDIVQQAIKKKEELDLTNDFYGNQNPENEDVVKFSAFGWAVYLALLINHHTSMNREHLTQSGVKWLHIYNSKLYFDQLFKLLKNADQNSALINILNRNICDNLNSSLARNKSLKDMFKDDQDPNDLVQTIKYHINIEPEAYLFYLNHSDQIKKEFIDIESVDQDDFSSFPDSPGHNIFLLKNNLLLKHVMRQTIDGKYENFNSTLQLLIKKKQFLESQALILCLYNESKDLPAEIVQYLVQLMSSQEDLQLPQNLRRDIDSIFQSQVVIRFLEIQDLKLNETYDQKGYLVTQSELLSGGISEEEINFFTPESLIEIKNCAVLSSDSQLNVISNEINTSKSIYSDVIHEQQNPLIDDLVNVLQQKLCKKGGMIANQAQYGQNQGLQLVRAAFAVMLKLNQNFANCLQEVYDMLDLMNGDDIPSEIGPERLKIISEICEQWPSFETLQKVWSRATKMRQWLQAKRQSINSKFSSNENSQSQEARENLEKNHLEEICKRVIEKADFLIKLEPSKQQSFTRSQAVFSRKPSYIKQISNSSLENQQILSDGTSNHGNQNQNNEEIEEASLTSVLSCLQSPVLCVEIQNQVQNSFIAAVRRYTGLCLLNKTIELSSEPQFYLDAVNCLKKLQENKKLTHYLDGIMGGCNSNLEAKIRQVMFEILQKLCRRIVATKDAEEAYTLLYAFQWQYQARDFDSLYHKLDIFQALSGRLGNQDSLLQKTWGQLNQENNTLKNDLLLTFQEIFITILSRITDENTLNEMKLKVYGNQNVAKLVPNLKKVRSLVDENASSLLVDSAVRVIFRFFDAIITQNAKLNGIKDLSIIQNFKKLEVEEGRLNYLHQITTQDVVVNKQVVDDTLEISEINIDLGNLSQQQILEDLINFVKKPDFNWESFSKVSKTEQVKNLPESCFEDIELGDTEKSLSHQHSMVKHSTFAYHSSWRCDKLKDSQICRSGKVSNTSHIKVEGWKCRSCDFDLCINCLQIERAIQRFTDEGKNTQAVVKPNNFNWLAHLEKSKTDQVIQLPSELYSSIQLGEIEIVQSHRHVLTKRLEQDRNTGWRCDKVSGSTQCRSGLHSFHQSSKVQGWRCIQCDFDLCDQCLQIDKCLEVHNLISSKSIQRAAEQKNDQELFDLFSYGEEKDPNQEKEPLIEYDWAQFFKKDIKTQVQTLPKAEYEIVNLREAEFSLTHNCTLKKKTNYQTNTRWRCNSLHCRLGLYPQYDSKGTEGWHCDACDFDLCIDCMKVEKRIRLQIEWSFLYGNNLWRNLDTTTKVKFVPKFLYNDIKVNDEEITSSHPHPLKKHVAGGTKPGCLDYNDYQCNKIKNSRLCVNKNKNYKIVPVWRCYDCRFDFCIDCLKIEKLFNETDNNAEIKSEQVQVVKEQTLSENQISELKVEMSELLIKSFEKQILADLINCVKLLSNISIKSQAAQSILQKIANPYYMRTLLQLLMVVSNQNKFLILGIFSDLIKLKIPLDVADEGKAGGAQPLLETKQVLGSYIADFLFEYAKQCAYNNNFEAVKIIIRTLQTIDLKIEPLLEKITKLDPLDQILVLMLCNCGAELKHEVIGDQMTFRQSELPVEELLILKSSNKNEIDLYSQSLNKDVTQKKQNLKLLQSKDKPLGLPSSEAVITILRSSLTNIYVRTMLLNMLINRKDEFQQFMRENQNEFVQFYLSESEELYGWIEKIKGDFNFFFIQDELETLLAQKLFKNFKPLPPLNFSAPAFFPQNYQEINPEDSQNLKQTRKNLVKCLYRNKQLKSQENKERKANIWKSCIHYRVDNSVTLPYYLIEDPNMREDFLKDSLSKDIIYPIEDFSGATQRAKAIIKQFEVDHIKRVSKDCPTLWDKIEFKFKVNFKPLFKQEVRHVEQKKKQSKLKVPEPNIKILASQRILELLFVCYNPTEVSDSEILWHLSFYYVQKKAYNKFNGLQKQGLTKRWIEILQQAPINFQHLFIQRIISEIYDYCRETLNHDNENLIIKYRNNCKIKAIGQLVTSNFEVFGVIYTPKLIEIILLNISRVTVRNSSGNLLAWFQKQDRLELKIIQNLIPLVAQTKNVKLFRQVFDNQYLQKFIDTASKMKPKRNSSPTIDYIYQFILVARNIEFQLIQIWDQFKKLGLQVGDQPKNSKKDYILKMKQFDLVIDKNTRLQTLRDLKPILKDAPTEWPQETQVISRENFGKWILLNELLPKESETEYKFEHVFKLKFEGESGVTVLLISSQPQINKETQYHFVSNEFSIKVDLNQPVYVMMQYQHPCIIDFDDKGKVKNQCIPSQFIEQQNIGQVDVICVPLSPDDSKIQKFLTNLGGNELYLIIQKYDEEIKKNKSQLIRIDGFSGKVKKIESGNQKNPFIIYNQSNLPFLLTQKAFKMAQQVKQSHYLKPDGTKVLVTLTHFEEQGWVIAGRGYTDNNTQLSIIGEVIFEDDCSIRIQEDGQPELILAAKWNSKLGLVVEGKDFYFNKNFIQLEPVLKETESQNHIFDVITYMEEPNKSLFAFEGDQLWNIKFEGKLKNQKIELPEEFQNCLNILPAQSGFDEGAQSLLLVTEKSGQNSIYIIQWKKSTSNKDENYGFNFISKIELDLTQIFWLKQSPKCFGVDKLGQFCEISLNDNSFSRKSVAENCKILNMWPKIFKHQGELACKFIFETDSLVPESKYIEKNIKVGEYGGEFETDNKKQIDLFKTWQKRGNLVYFEFLTNTSIHLIDPLSQNFSKFEYALIKPNEASKGLKKDESKDLDQTDLQLCIDYLNIKMKDLKFRKMKSLLIKEKKTLNQIIDLKDLNGYNPDLVSTIIAANQFVYEQKEYIMAMSNDQAFFDLTEFKVFADQFMIPHLLFFIQYLAQKSYIYRTHGSSEKKCRFDRLNSEYTLFEQLFKQVFSNSTRIFRKSTEDRPFRARMMGENSYDAGGPFRDVMENICTEISNIYFKPTNNNEVLDDVSSQQPRILKSISDLQRFLLIGKMIGWSLTSTTFNLSLDLNIIFWKYLCKLPITIDDLQHVDLIRYNMVKSVLSDEYQSNFEADLGDGEMTELIEGGSEIPVTNENKDQFAELYLQKYLEQDKIIYETIIRGINAVASPQMVGLLTPKSGPLLAFSTPKINPDVLIAQLKMEEEEDDAKKCLSNFKQMVRDFNNKERQLLVKFITGSSRLGPGRVINLNYYDSQDDRKYPIGHTCGESVDIWNYSTLEIMTEKFRTAISSCGEIDDDHNYYDSESENGEGENDHGEGQSGEDSQNSEGENQGEGESESDENSSSDSSRSRQIRSLGNNSQDSRSRSRDYQFSRDSQFYGDLQSYGDEDGQGRGESSSDSGEGEGEDSSSHNSGGEESSSSNDNSHGKNDSESDYGSSSNSSHSKDSGSNSGSDDSDEEEEENKKTKAKKVDTEESDESIGNLFE